MMNSDSQIEKPLDHLVGVVERITFHNADNGWSVLKVGPLESKSKEHDLSTVLLHQSKIFTGISMDFWGTWIQHPKHGRQFKAERALERKPTTCAAIEKYLGSGLIKGLGAKTAEKIVAFFKEKTLEVFDENIDEVIRVPGISN